MSDILDAPIGFKQRYQEIRDGEFAPSVYVESPASVASSHQRFFLGSTDRITIASSQTLRAVLQNPAGSGRRLIVGRITTVNEGTAPLYALVYVNPTGNLATTSAHVLNATIGSSVPSVAVCRADAGAAMSGGQQIATLGIPSGLKDFDFPGLVIAPGVTLGLGFSIGALTTAYCQMSMTWVEQDENDA